jgi:hypothetical protein
MDPDALRLHDPRRGTMKKSPREIAPKRGAIGNFAQRWGRMTG